MFKDTIMLMLADARMTEPVQMKDVLCLIGLVCAFVAVSIVEGM